jgi:hypothetical protein
LRRSINIHAKPVSLIYAVLLIACMCLASLEVFGTLFAIGDTDSQIGFYSGSLLAVTALGAVGLLIAALGSFAMHKSFNVIALAGGLGVTPMSLRYFGQAMYPNSWLSSPEDAACGVLATALVLAVIWLSWLRLWLPRPIER